MARTSIIAIVSPALARYPLLTVQYVLNGFQILPSGSVSLVVNAEFYFDVQRLEVMLSDPNFIHLP